MFILRDDEKYTQLIKVMKNRMLCQNNNRLPKENMLLYKIQRLIFLWCAIHIQGLLGINTIIYGFDRKVYFIHALIIIKYL